MITTIESEKSSLTLPEIHRLDQHRDLWFFPHLDWYISNCNGHVVLGVDGGPCAPESTPKFYATCEFKFKDIADVAPLCGTKIESLENDMQWRIDLKEKFDSHTEPSHLHRLVRQRLPQGRIKPVTSASFSIYLTRCSWTHWIYIQSTLIYNHLAR